MQRYHKLIWLLVLIVFVSLGIAALTTAIVSRIIPFETAQNLVNSFSADKKVDHFTPDTYAFVVPAFGIAGLVSLAIAASWVIFQNKSRHFVEKTAILGLLSFRLYRSQIASSQKTNSIAKTHAAILFFSFFIYYMGTSLFVMPLVSLNYFTLVFDVDTRWVIPAISAAGGQSPRHPLLKLFLYPIGHSLSILFNNPTAAALIITALFGAVFVLILFTFLQKAGIDPTVAALWSAVAGLSSAHVFYASVPESYIFSATGLVLMYAVMSAAPGNMLLAIPSGIFSMGVTSTNIIHGAFTFSASLWDKASRFRPSIARIFSFVAMVMLITAILDVTSILIFHVGVPYLLPWFYSEEAISYTTLIRPFSPLERAVNLTEHFLAYNIVAPKPFVAQINGPYDPNNWPTIQPKLVDNTGEVKATIIFANSSIKNYRPIGILALTLWLGLLIAGITQYVRYPAVRSKLMIAIILSLIFNFVFHMFYGFVMFLYVAHWTFLMISFPALALRKRSFHWPLVVLLIVLIFLLLINNTWFLMDLYAILK